MKTEYDADAAFFTSQPGGAGMPLFSPLMLRSRVERALLQAALWAHFKLG